jgi:hypothetical protein
MLEVLVISLLLIPLVLLILLFQAQTDKLRRSWLMLTGIFLLNLLVWNLLLRWVIQGYRSMEINHDLFEGVGGKLLSRFFDGMWPSTVYALAIAIAGYFANRHALRRTRKPYSGCAASPTTRAALSRSTPMRAGFVASSSTIGVGACIPSLTAMA